MHGRPAMIVYTSICRPVSEYPAKTFRFLMEIMSGLKQVCMAETVLSPGCAIKTSYDIQIHDCKLTINLRSNQTFLHEF